MIKCAAVFICHLSVKFFNCAISWFFFGIMFIYLACFFQNYFMSPTKMFRNLWRMLFISLFCHRLYFWLTDVFYQCLLLMRLAAEFYNIHIYLVTQNSRYTLYSLRLPFCRFTKFIIFENLNTQFVATTTTALITQELSVVINTARIAHNSTIAVPKATNVVPSILENSSVTNPRLIPTSIIIPQNDIYSSNSTTVVNSVISPPESSHHTPLYKKLYQQLRSWFKRLVLFFHNFPSWLRRRRLFLLLLTGVLAISLIIWRLLFWMRYSDWPTVVVLRAQAAEIWRLGFGYSFGRMQSM